MTNLTDDGVPKYTFEMLKAEHGDKLWAMKFFDLITELANHAGVSASVLVASPLLYTEDGSLARAVQRLVFHASVLAGEAWIALNYVKWHDCGDDLRDPEQRDHDCEEPDDYTLDSLELDSSMCQQVVDALRCVKDSRPSSHWASR